MKLNNNLIAIILLLFILVSLSSNFIITNKIKTIKATGKAVTTGQVVLCMNNPPILAPIGNQNATNGILFTLYINASDKDGNSLTFSDNSSFFNITNINSSTGVINFTPSQEDRGNHTINITVIDNSGCAFNSDSETINFTIIYNEPPVLNPIGQQNLSQNSLYYYDVNASDPDNDTLTFSDNASIFNIDSSTGIITFTPSQSDVGLHYINISVKDIYNAVDFEIVLFNISNINDAPVLDFISNQTAYINLTFQLSTTASDLDNDNLTFYDNATFFNISTLNPTTGFIEFTSANDIGNHSILIWVWDHYNDSCCIDTQVVLFTIEPYNFPPIARMQYPLGGEAVFGNISINATAWDEDGNDTLYPVRFYYTNGTGWNYLSNNSYDGDSNYNITWDTTSVPDGYKYKIKINVTDGVNKIENASGKFVINNLDQEPIWDNFKYNITTNFTLLNDPLVLGEFTNIANVTIGIPEIGLINFTGQILNVDGIDMDTYITISPRTMGIDTSELWQLEKPATLTFYNITYLNPDVLMDGADCPLSVCTVLEYSNNKVIVNVTRFSVFTVTEGSQSNLILWDSTDLGMVRYANQNVKFYANYTDATTHHSINGTGIYCTIDFNITGNLQSNLSFNQSSLLYEYNRSFSRRGAYIWNVTCNGSALSLGTISNSDFVNITNTAPSLAANIPDISWYASTSIINWIDLDNHFLDMDADLLSCSYAPVSSITISIDSSNRVSLIPSYGWYGLRTSVFECTDTINSTNSNNFTMLVQIPPQAPQDSGSASTGGGGGGGAIKRICEEMWICSDWSKCFVNSTQSRSCIDYANCRIANNKPNETQQCWHDSCFNGIPDYDETGTDCGGSCPPCANCSDGMKNCHDGSCEILIDCGGPCSPCPTCDDGEQNDGETDVDCGGPCSPCTSCFDRIQNQQETGIDCGGPCPQCKNIEQPSLVEKKGALIAITLSILIALVIIIILTKYTSGIMDRVKVILYSRRRLPQTEKRYLVVTLLNQLTVLEKSMGKTPIEDISINLVSIAKKFFKERFRLHEFNYSDVLKRAVKEKIDSITMDILKYLLKDLMNMESKKYAVTKGDAKEVMRKLRIIIETISQGGKW